MIPKTTTGRPRHVLARITGDLYVNIYEVRALLREEDDGPTRIIFKDDTELEVVGLSPTEVNRRLREMTSDASETDDEDVKTRRRNVLPRSVYE